MHERNVINTSAAHPLAHCAFSEGLSQYQVGQGQTAVLGSLDLASSTQVYKFTRKEGRSTVANGLSKTPSCHLECVWLNGTDMNGLTLLTPGGGFQTFLLTHRAPVGIIQRSSGSRCVCERPATRYHNSDLYYSKLCCVSAV